MYSNPSTIEGDIDAFVTYKLDNTTAYIYSVQLYWPDATCA